MLIGIGVGVVVAGVGIWLFGWPRLQNHIEARNLRHIEEFVAKKDYRRAQLALEQAVQVRPDNLAARRRLAAFYQQAGSIQAMEVWREIVRLDPGNEANRIEWAESALHFGATDLAREALQGVGPNGRTADYHRIAAGLALATGDKETLSRELNRLAELEPASIRLRFSALAVDMLSVDRAVAAAARQQMEELAREGTFRIRATLALIRVEEAREKETAHAALADRILPNEDRLYPSGQKRGVRELITYMMAEPDPKPGDAAILGQWLCERGFAREGALWLAELAPDTRMAPAVLRTRAECAAAIQDWDALEPLLEAGAWGGVPPTAINLAFKAQSQREEADLITAGRTWEQALDAAENSRPAFTVMFRLASLFGWENKEERTLLRIVAEYPRENWAWSALVAGAERRGDGAKALEHYRKWARAMPDLKPVRAQMVLLAAILERMDVETRSQLDNMDLLSEPALLVAQALLQWRQGETLLAATTINNIPPRHLQEPRLAVVAAAILADAGEQRQSTQLSDTLTGNGLLPEECALLDGARRRNRFP